MKHTLKEYMTSGGARLLCIDIPGVTSCEIAIALRCGYRFAAKDDPAKYEIPHILEHMVFEGSRSHPTNDDLQHIFTRGGGDSNGFTTPYHNVFAFHARSSHLKHTLQAAFDMIYFPLLKSQALDEEREVIRNEHLERMNDFTLNAMTFTSQEISHEGSLAANQQLALLDIPTLEDIKAYHRTYYTQGNTQIVIAMDFSLISQTECVSLIEKCFKDVPSGSLHTFPKYDVQPSTGQFHVEKVGRSIQDTTLALSFARQGEDTPTTRLALQLITQIASGMKSYSINYKLRKKGLTYGLDLSPFSSIESYGIDLNLTAHNEKTTNILGHILGSLLYLSANGVSEEQFDREKQMLLGNLEEATDSPGSIMGWYMDDYLITGTYRRPEEDIHLLKKLDQTSVLAITKPLVDHSYLYGSIFTSKPFRMSSAIVSITEAIMRDKKPLTQQVVDESSILLASLEGSTFRIFTAFILTLLGAAFALPLVDMVFQTATIAHVTYTTYGWWILFIILNWIAVYALLLFQKLSELRKYLMQFGIWCMFALAILPIFSWDQVSHLSNAGWVHAGIVIACIIYLISPWTFGSILSVGKKILQRA